jgi:hypothetical protein
MMDDGEERKVEIVDEDGGAGSEQERRRAKRYKGRARWQIAQIEQ